MAQDEKHGKSRQAEDRKARLAAALRANLKKRKEQARSRAARDTARSENEPR
jgi:hypothetical protein